MNFRKLLTYFAFGTAAVMPLAVAQNPTILQGNYITNVFGNSNFVLNPNAQTNIANVTVSSATVTRSTTTPLVATSEFNITTSTSTGYADWSTRTFDAGMKGQNCEARFSYRGFTVGSTKAQILQGANVVAELTLVGDANNPKQASINFPCGDLSAVTKFRLQQATASLTGTNEIGGAYVGLATNMANVAQAEAVGGYKVTVAGTKPGTTSATFANLISGTATQVLFGKATSSDSASGSVTFSSLPAGNYMIVYTSHSNSPAATSCQYQWFEDTSTDASGFQYNSGDTNWSMVSGYFSFTTATSRTFRIQGKRSVGSGTCQIDHAVNAQIVVYRFPSSSELVVTPERQNVWGGAQFTGGAADISTSTGGSWVRFSDPVAQNFTAFGSASSSKTSCTYGGGGAVGANDVAICMPVIPPGTYKVTLQTRMSATSTADCNFRFSDGTTGFGMLNVSSTANNTLVGIIKYNSMVFNRGIAVEAWNNGGGGTCNLLVASFSFGRTPQFIFEPLDQPSNSALYVQGPVRGAATGAAIPAGYVGYELSASSTADITTSTTELAYATLTGASIDVPAGVWLVIGEFFGYPGNASGGAGIINLGQIYNSSDSSAIISRRVHATPTTTNTSSGGGKTITTVVNLTSQKTLILRGAIQKAGGAETITSGGFFPSSQNTIRAIRLN